MPSDISVPVGHPNPLWHGLCSAVSYDIVCALQGSEHDETE